MKKVFSSIFIQILPVMIGVYLGFALNNFGEKQKQDKQVATFREMLRDEIEFNLSAVEKVYPYHQQLATDFSEIMKSKQLKKSFDNYEMKGLKPGFVNDSSFETGLQTGHIQSFDLDLIQKLNHLYSYQKDYKNFNQVMVNSLLSMKFPETESEIRSAIISLHMALIDVLNFEVGLQEYYKSALEIL